jgi:hypothetical protein
MAMSFSCSEHAQAFSQGMPLDQSNNRSGFEQELPVADSRMNPFS